MYVVDMHCDSLLEVSAERGLKNAYNLSREYPQLQFFAEFVPFEGREPAERRRMLMHYLDVYIAERSRLDLVPIMNCHDLNFAMECEKHSSLLAIEGGGGLFADSEELKTLYRAGLRVLGIAWDTNELATASSDRGEDRGLSAAGRALVERASEMGIILDVSHLSDRSTAELLELTPYPVIATHSNFREVCNTPRNLPRSLARAITARGGVIGLNLYPPTLRESGAVMEDILRHVDYALEFFGESSIGFGFDIDGTDGEYPIGLDEHGSIHDRVIDMLLSHYSASVVEGIAGGNVINFLKCNL